MICLLQWKRDEEKDKKKKILINEDLQVSAGTSACCQALV